MENYYPIVVNYRIQTMSHCQNCAFTKFTLDGVLDQTIGFHVHISCRLIQDNDLVLS